MRGYTHFSLEERGLLFLLRRDGKNQREIAEVLGKSISSVSRELSRNSDSAGGYSALSAQKQYRGRRERCVRRLRFDEDEALKVFVMQGLDMFWSPEIISARWDGAPVGHTTIYRALRENLLPGYSEASHLKRRRPFEEYRKETMALGGRPTLRERPAVVSERSRIGDWEGDTVLGKNGKGALVTVLERKSRFLRMRVVRDLSPLAVEAAVCAGLRCGLPVRTLTLDNGSEFANFRRIEEALGISVFFADAHSPWQRGSNENVNRLVRYFFPKGFDFSRVTQEDVDGICEVLNNRPRKCLGWFSPAEYVERCTWGDR